MDLTKRLEALAGLLTDDLIEKLERGDATPSDRNVARQLIKDAGLELSPIKAAELKDVIDEDLPFTEDEEEFEYASSSAPLARLS